MQFEGLTGTAHPTGPAPQGLGLRGAGVPTDSRMLQRSTSRNAAAGGAMFDLWLPRPEWRGGYSLTRTTDYRRLVDTTRLATAGEAGYEPSPRLTFSVSVSPRRTRTVDE